MSKNAKEKSELGKQRWRWTEESDVLLHREVLSDVPFQGEHGKTISTWEACAKEVAMAIQHAHPELLVLPNGRVAQQRAKDLLKSFTSDENQSAKASGVVEDYTEKQVQTQINNRDYLQN